MADKPKITDYHGTIDYYGDTHIVNTLSKEDLQEYLTPEEYAKVTEDDVTGMADKLSDAILDCAYWDCLDVLVDEVLKPDLAERK